MGSLCDERKIRPVERAMEARSAWMSVAGWAAPNCAQGSTRLAILDLKPGRPSLGRRENENRYHSRSYFLFQLIDAFQLHHTGISQLYVD
jgi:hypothetical protein